MQSFSLIASLFRLLLCAASSSWQSVMDPGGAGGGGGGEEKGRVLGQPDGDVSTASVIL